MSRCDFSKGRFVNVCGSFRVSAVKGVKKSVETAEWVVFV